jgi:hypothetical protein
MPELIMASLFLGPSMVFLRWVLFMFETTLGLWNPWVVELLIVLLSTIFELLRF